jgi:predicted dehydrogenase
LRHAGGALTHIQASWDFPKGSFRTSLEIAGSDGLLTIHASEPFTSIAAGDEEASEVPQPPTTLAESPYVTQMRHFSNVLHGSAEPLVTAADGAAAVAICAAVERSIETGAAIELEVGR